MPTLDVTEILDDPDICDTFSVIQRTETANSFGESTLTETQTDNVVGVVVPGSGTLTREDDHQSLTKTISVVTTFRLQGPSPGFQADIVVWKGSRYLVTTLDDLTNYGAGHVEAECVSVNLVDPPP
jgi:hypothetical protein